MKLTRYKYIIFFYCLLGVIVTSCKSKQQIVYSTTPVEEKENDELFSDIVSNCFPYNTFSSKLNINFTNGSRSLNSKANIRIVKDSAIQISVQPLFGVEMFRFYIDPDTVMVLDRMNQCYVKESISSLKEYYPVGFDFYTMQSIFTNAPFVSGKNRVEDSDYQKFRYTQTSDRNYYLVAEDPSSGIEYSFTVNGDDRITFTHLMLHQKRQSLQWAYANFATLGETTFPHKMNATITSKSQKMKMRFLFSDVVTNEPIFLSINVPDNYRSTTVSEILKIIEPDK